jgi:predicted dehydrogenase
VTVTNKLGIAVVGCGMLAQGMHLPNITRHAGLDLLWCCDVNADALAQASEGFGPRRTTADAREIAADPDCAAVVLATTQTVRLPLIELFARAGKHIFVEKPLADSFDEMKRILAVVRETGVKLTVGHNRRVAPAVREAARVLEKHRTNPVSPPWRWNREGDDRPELPGKDQTMVLLRVNDDFWSWKKWAFAHGALINEMTHFADLACVFIPSRPVRVTTIGGKDANHVVTVEYEDTSIATIFATAFGSFGYPKELVEVYHNGAAIVIDHLMEVRVAGVADEPFRTTFPVIGDRHPEIEPSEGIEAYYRRVEAAQAEAIAKGDNSILPGQPNKGHFALLDDFVQSIIEDREPACSARIAAVSTAIILRALESEAKGGATVAIRPEDLT